MADSTPIDTPSERAEGGASGEAPGEALGESSPGQSEPGAPIGPGQIDPELVKLARTRMRIGVITAAGIVFLCIVFLLRLGPDRRFAGSDTRPTPVAVADVLAGRAGTDQLVVLTAEPVVSRAIRTTKSAGSLGLRVVPARGAGDRLWIVISGDGWDPPAAAGYVGRLRKLDDLPFAKAARAYAAGHPRPVFATAGAVRAGFATGTVTTVAGEQVTLADRDAVQLDTIDPGAVTVAASFNNHLPDAAAWKAALLAAGLTVTRTGTPDEALGQVRFTVAASADAASASLDHARLFAARIEPIARHYQTTWGALRASPPAGLDLGGTVLPDAQIDLLGLDVARAIPGDAYALVTGELPDDYWYVMPITIALAVILLVFAWALVRAIRRDFLPARAA